MKAEHSSSCGNAFSSNMYFQMRDLVTRKTYRLRKAIDDFLFWLLPKRWVPLYNSVSFTHMPYKQCIANRKWQDKVCKCNFKQLKTHLEPNRTLRTPEKCLNLRSGRKTIKSGRAIRNFFGFHQEFPGFF